MDYPDMNESIRREKHNEELRLLVRFRTNHTFVLRAYQVAYSKFHFLFRYKERINGQWTGARTQRYIH